jgi:hypothetical protein
VHEAVQGAIHVHHDPHVQHELGQAHVEVQEGYDSHQSDPHDQEVVLDTLRSCSGCRPCTL